jgi:DNA (cytosine-5)-methyltransferase 1
VADVAPRYVFAENVQKRAIDRAADDLEQMGYSVKCIPLSAADVGADHRRPRYWLRAHADMHRELRGPVDAKAPLRAGIFSSIWKAEPDEPRVADGLAFSVERLAATGNGQIPCVAATAWSLLT